MLRTTAILAGLLAAGPPAAAQDDAAQKVLDKLQGEWKLVAAEGSGKPVAKEDVATITLVIKGDAYEFREGAKVEKGTLRLDPSAKPARLDVEAKDGPDAGKKQVGIYELADGKWKLCVSQPGDPKRPTKFATTAEDRFILMEFARAGRGETPAPSFALMAERPNTGSTASRAFAIRHVYRSSTRFAPGRKLSPPL